MTRTSTRCSSCPFIGARADPLHLQRSHAASFGGSRRAPLRHERCLRGDRLARGAAADVRHRRRRVRVRPPLVSGAAVRRPRPARRPRAGRPPPRGRLRDWQGDPPAARARLLGLCIELGARLAAEARRNLAGLPVEVHAGRFEDWDAEPASFGLVYAATAWTGWIRQFATRRTSSCGLGGHLALWKARHAFPDGPTRSSPRSRRSTTRSGRATPARPPAPPNAVADDGRRSRRAGLPTSRLRRYVWELAYTADEYVALLRTFSGHIAMEPEKRGYLFSEVRRRIQARPDERVRRHWLAIPHVARAG